MPSATYNLIRQAIVEQANIRATYHGFLRDLTPHILGTKVGLEQALFFQFAGGSESGLPPGGEWRCLILDELSAVSTIGGELHSAHTQGQPQTCVDIVDVQITL